MQWEGKSKGSRQKDTQGREAPYIYGCPYPSVLVSVDPGRARLHVHKERGNRDASAPQGTGRNFSSLAANTAAYVGTNPSVSALKAGSESNQRKNLNTSLWQARLRKKTQNPVFSSLSSSLKAQES